MRPEFTVDLVVNWCLQSRDLFILVRKDIGIIKSLLWDFRGSIFPTPTPLPHTVTKRCWKEEQSSLLNIYLLMINIYLQMSEFFPLTHHYNKHKLSFVCVMFAWMNFLDNSVAETSGKKHI